MIPWEENNTRYYSWAIHHQQSPILCTLNLTSVEWVTSHLSLQIQNIIAHQEFAEWSDNIDDQMDAWALSRSPTSTAATSPRVTIQDAVSSGANSLQASLWRVTTRKRALPPLSSLDRLLPPLQAVFSPLTGRVRRDRNPRPQDTQEQNFFP